MILRIARSPEDRAASFALRLSIFVEEQGVPESLERDSLDDLATHFLALDESGLVGTARLIPQREGVVKAGRVAVRADRRGEGIGDKLMCFAEDWAKSEGFSEILLHAQEPVVGFYLKLGYVAIGERFHEAEIHHFKMKKLL